MIASYLKKTWDVDVVRPLEVYIKDTYGKEKVNKLKQELMEIQQLRNHCIVSDQSVAPSIAIPQHEEYYNMLCILEKRFQFGKSGRGMFTKAKAVEILFQWGDSYRHVKIEKSMDLKLEKRSILFNIASLMSLNAVKLTEQDEEGLKNACKLFKQSAGVFDFLSSKESGDSQGIIQNMDIHTDSAKFLSAVMLAQAQACFVDMVCHLIFIEPQLHCGC